MHDFNKNRDFCQKYLRTHLGDSSAWFLYIYVYYLHFLHSIQTNLN